MCIRDRGVVELAGDPASDEADQAAAHRHGEAESQPRLLPDDEGGDGREAADDDPGELVGRDGGEEQGRRSDADQHLVLGVEVGQHGVGAGVGGEFCLVASCAGEQVVAQRVGPGQLEVAQLDRVGRTDVDLEFRQAEHARRKRLDDVDRLHLVEGDPGGAARCV